MHSAQVALKELNPVYLSITLWNHHLGVVERFECLIDLGANMWLEQVLGERFSPSQ